MKLAAARIEPKDNPNREYSWAELQETEGIFKSTSTEPQHQSLRFISLCPKHMGGANVILLVDTISPTLDMCSEGVWGTHHKFVATNEQLVMAFWKGDLPRGYIGSTNTKVETK